MVIMTISTFGDKWTYPMAGQIKKMLNQIIEFRANGDSFIALTTKTKLVLKGIDPEKYNDDSEDDALVINRVTQIANELGVRLEG